MKMIKRFESSDLIALQEIIGKKFTSFFKQLEMFIINFGDEIEFSLHTYCFCRIRSEKEIILTSNDEYYDLDYNYLSDEDYEKDELHEKTLLNSTIKKANRLLKNSVVSKVVVNNNADILIEFNNGIIFETLIDRKSQDFEYYRFIKFVPSYEEIHKKNIRSKGPHAIVSFKDKKIVFQLLNDGVSKN